MRRYQGNQVSNQMQQQQQMNNTDSEGDHEELMQLVKDQVSSEIGNSMLYLDLSATLSHMGCFAFSKYMCKWSHEETEHALRFMNFILQKGCNPEFSYEGYEHKELDCVCDITEEIYQREKATTKKIENIYEAACEAKCPMVKELALSFLQEQMEEEQVALTLCKMWENADGHIGEFEAQMCAFMEHKCHRVGALGRGGKTFY